MLQTIRMKQHCFLTSIKLDTSNVLTRIITKVLLWCIAKLTFAFTFTGHFKSIIKGFKFIFSDFFSLQIKLLPCNQNNLDASKEIGCLCNTWKFFRTKQKNRKGYVQLYKKMKKVLCFAIVLISSSKFSFKGKNYLKLIIHFNFSNKTFMQKGTDQRPFDFFQFWYTKSVCLFKGLLYCLN